jgi:ABC-type amino acid transport system permease subunit
MINETCAIIDKGAFLEAIKQGIWMTFSISAIMLFVGLIIGIILGIMFGWIYFKKRKVRI